MFSRYFVLCCKIITSYNIKIDNQVTIKKEKKQTTGKIFDLRVEIIFAIKLLEKMESGINSSCIIQHMR